MEKIWRWVLLVSLLLLVQIVLTWPDSKLRVVQCDVGQGDATLIYKGTTQVLIDGGPPNNLVLDCLSRHMPFWDRKIELVVATHADADHIGGLIEVVERYDVEMLLAPDLAHTTDLYWWFYSAVKDNEVKVVTARQGQVLKLGEMRWEVLWPDRVYGEELVWEYEFNFSDSEVLREQAVPFIARQPRDQNSASVAMWLDYKDFSGFFSGEINVAEDRLLASQNKLGSAYLMKVSHHGSKTGTSEEKLRSVRPKVGLIGVGANNRYGHPHREVVERLEEYGVEIGRTDLHGELVVWTDGVVVGRSW